MRYYIIAGLKRHGMLKPRRPINEEMPVVRSIESIIEIVLRHKDIPEEQILGKSRKREVVYARHLCMLLAHDYSRLTLKSVGERLGGRDHTTVIHAKQSIQNQIDTDDVVREEVRILRSMIIP